MSGQSDYQVRITGNENLSSTLAKLRKEADGFKTRVEKLKKSSEIFDEVAGSTVSARQKVKELKVELERMALQGLENEAVFKKMAKEVARLEKGFKKARNAVKEAGEAAKVAKNNGLSQFAGAGTAAAGVLGLIGGAGSDAAAKILMLQSSIATLQGSMQALEGTKFAGALSNPYVLAGAAAAAAGVAWFNYNKEMEATMHRTAQFTGLAGGELLSLRNGIKSVASTWDKDYNTVLSTVDGLMAQYGIDGERALTAVRDGLVAGADEAGKMGEMISKYAGSFNDAGISAEELVAIIANTRSGIFDEKGMDLFQMGAKNIRDMSKKAREAISAIGIDVDEMKAKLQSGEITTVAALKQISKKLKELSPQSAEVGAVLQNVFGKKGAAAGYQLVTALADVETKLDVMKKQTGEVGEATERLQRAHRRLEDALSMVFMTSEGGFETMTTTLKAEVLEAVAAVIQYYVDLYNECIAVRGAILVIGATFKTVWEVVKAILKLWLPAMKALNDAINSLGHAMDALKTGNFKGIKEAWREAGTAISDAWDEIKTDMVDAGIEIAVAWSSAVQNMGKKLDGPEISIAATGNKTSDFVKGNGGTGTPGDGDKSKKKREAEAGSIADLQAKIKALDDELLNSANLSTERIASIKAERAELERLIQDLKNLQRGQAGPAVAIEAAKPQALMQTATPALDQLQTKTGAGLAGNDIMNGMQERLNAQYEAFRAQREKIKGIIDGMRGDTDAGVQSFINLAEVMKDSMATSSEKAATALGTVGASLQQLGADGPIAKVGAVMAAVGQAVLGFATASAQASSLGPWGWLAFVGAGLGTLAAMISTIKGFNAGGIIEGNSFHGDQMLARVNAGEMVLTRPQQGRLFDILNGGGGTPGGGGVVRFVLEGNQLVGLIDNYNRKMGKIR